VSATRRGRAVAGLLATAALLAACGRPADPSALAVPTSTAPVIRTDIVSRHQLNGSLTYAGSYTVINQAGPGVYTRLPSPGAVVTRGHALYRVDSRPIPLFYGDPEWRSLAVGVADGADVKQLELNLLALGFANASNLRANGHYDWYDAAAVRRWQASLGVPQTGIVGSGDVVYEPGAIRVASVHPTAGVFAQPGQPVLEATSTEHVVTVALDVNSEGSIKVGDAVTVALPYGTNSTSGRVGAIGSVATAAPSAGSNAVGPPQASVPVTITLDDPSAGGSLDQAPVTVGVTDTLHKGVLAVPVVALLAQPGGTYAVVAVGGFQRREVTVTTGLFDDRGLVEVSGPDLREGMLVEVPQS
jgi:peptidoglycan hydrolase-like protein with peptidoglycan-binding domain